MTGKVEHGAGVVNLKARITRSALFSAHVGIVHGLTGRVPGMGRADGNIGYSAPRDRADAWAMRQQWCAALGVAPESLVTVRQVHGAAVALARRQDAGRGACPGSEPLGYADAIITNEPGVTLMTLHADCLPVLLFDPEQRAVAAIHAGWRGTVGNVVGNTVSAMQDAFGTRPDRLVAFLGSAIRQCCYEVGDEVVQAWQALAGARWQRAAVVRQGRWYFDVVLANQWILEECGLPRDQIEISSVCTRCSGDQWFSHRGQGADTGRFAAMIALTEARE